MRFRTVSLTAKIIFIERRMVLGILENWIPEEKIAHNVTQDVYEIVSVVVVTTVVCTHSFYPSTKMFNVCSMYHVFDIRIWKQKYFDYHIVRNHSVPEVEIVIRHISLLLGSNLLNLHNYDLQNRFVNRHKLHLYVIKYILNWFYLRLHWFVEIQTHFEFPDHLFKKFKANVLYYMNSVD